MAAIVLLVRQSPALFLCPVEPGPVTLSCPLQPLLSVPHLPQKASLARLATVTCAIPRPSLGPQCQSRVRVCRGVMGEGQAPGLCLCSSTFQNILGHRSCLFCEAALRQTGDLSNAAGGQRTYTSACHLCARHLALSLPVSPGSCAGRTGLTTARWLWLLLNLPSSRLHCPHLH